MPPAAELTVSAQGISDTLRRLAEASGLDVVTYMARATLERERRDAHDQEAWPNLFAWARSDGTELPPRRMPLPFCERVNGMAARGKGLPVIEEARCYVARCEANEAVDEAEAELEALDEHHTDWYREQVAESLQTARNDQRAVYGEEEEQRRRANARGTSKGVMLSARIVHRARSFCGGRRRPRGRRIVGRSTGGGSGGDPPEPEPPGEHLAGRRQHHHPHPHLGTGIATASDSRRHCAT
jgi:hypothetical protein